MDTIFTLNARGNIFLEVVRDRFGLSSQQMHLEIRAMFKDAEATMAASEVKYQQLKSGLVPSTEKVEIALLFDSQAIESYAYGYEVMCRVLPLLDHRTTQSALVGDIVGGSKDQELIYRLLCDELQPARNFEFIHSTLIYCVYLNNLSESAAKNIFDSLREYPAFIGVVPTTFHSSLKTILSFGLCNLFIKHGKEIILAHEDDRPNAENVNITMYPFEKFGYTVRSIQQHLFSHFLSYKIEREVVPGFKSDTEFSLNAISPLVSSLEALEVTIEPAKLKYLKAEKQGSLKNAGLLLSDEQEIKTLIRRKLASNYIYNLRYNTQHDVMLFNIVLEVERQDGGYPARLLLALEYQPADHKLRVVTMY